MVNPKEVFYSPGFMLPDGYIHDTWFVIISGGTPFQDCLCLKSTTQSDRYFPAANGCNHKKIHNSCFYISKKWQECFAKDSYLVLPHIFTVPLVQLLALRDEGKYQFKGQLTQDCFDDLIACLLGFEDDIDQDHYTRLLSEL